jgi:hypothetical protein
VLEASSYTCALGGGGTSYPIGVYSSNPEHTHVLGRKKIDETRKIRVSGEPLSRVEGVYYEVKGFRV